MTLQHGRMPVQTSECSSSSSLCAPLALPTNHRMRLSMAGVVPAPVLFVGLVAGRPSSKSTAAARAIGMCAATTSTIIGGARGAIII